MKPTCYDCRYSKLNKFYDCYCHYGLTGAFAKDGIPVRPDNSCTHFEGPTMSKPTQAVIEQAKPDQLSPPVVDNGQDVADKEREEG